MHVCDTWSFSAISRVVLWRSESIIVLIRSSSTSTEIRNYLVANPIIKYTNKSVFYLYVYLYISWGGGSWSCVSCVISSCNFTWRERRRSPWSPSWRIFHWHETTREGGGGTRERDTMSQIKASLSFSVFASRRQPRDAKVRERVAVIQSGIDRGERGKPRGSLETSRLRQK